MNKSKGVIPDFKIWHDYFYSRKTSRERIKITNAFKLDRVYTTGIIIAQLFSRSTPDKVEKISPLIRGLNIIDIKTEDYMWSGKITSFLIENKTPLPSSIVLHYRISDLYSLEFLTREYEKEFNTVLEGVKSCCKKEDNYYNFIVKRNQRYYLGSGYKDKYKAKFKDIDIDTIFPFPNDFKQLYKKKKKGQPHITDEIYENLKGDFTNVYGEQLPAKIVTDKNKSEMVLPRDL